MALPLCSNDLYYQKSKFSAHAGGKWNLNVLCMQTNLKGAYSWNRMWWLKRLTTCNSICSQKNIIQRLGGRGRLWAKQFMTFSVSVKHKKDKKLFLHMLSLFLPRLIFTIFTYTVCSCIYNQACSFNRKRLEQVFTLSTEHLFNFYCHAAHNLN